MPFGCSLADCSLFTVVSGVFPVSGRSVEQLDGRLDGRLDSLLDGLLDDRINGPLNDLLNSLLGSRLDGLLDGQFLSTASILMLEHHDLLAAHQEFTKSVYRCLPGPNYLPTADYDCITVMVVLSEHTV